MKPALLATLFIFLTPGLVLAQAGGAICFFSDPNGTDCALSDTTPGVLTVYVVHTFVPGAVAIQFSAPKPACMVGATWLDDTNPFPVTVGNSQTGVGIGYGTCLSGPIHILSVNYVVSGTTTADCRYRALPPSGTFDIEVLDCSNDFWFGNGGSTYINSNLPCDCSGEAPGIPVLSVTPARLDFGELDAVQMLQISNAGGGALSWWHLREEAWILVDPPFGTGETSVEIKVNRRDKSTSTGVLTIVSNGGTIDVPVSVRTSRWPVLYVNPTTLDLGDAATSASFAIENIGRWRRLEWTITDNLPWLTVSRAIGTNNAVILVTVDRTELVPGPYTGVVRVASNGGTAEVTVAMTVVTTPVATPVEESTWGRVKSLYYGPGT